MCVFGLGGSALVFDAFQIRSFEELNALKRTFLFLLSLLFAETKETTIQLINQMQMNAKNSTKKQLRILYDSITIHKRNTSRTQSKQQTKKKDNEQLHKRITKQITKQKERS
ncbi:hypothetical protein OCF65_08480 [Bacillus toyonensis]|uniref:hypothetical protein n=1 Tax=Bacillus toyonensis TaxID=155322 RepID=UPI0021D3D93E|nr:hypothetical protein [Bacillus toyonensis]MCU5580524.1 hypothetical protein [Bacillus toyonensis]